jgi:hypothetical protein
VPRLLLAVLAALSLTATLGVPSPAAAAAPTRVAIIVGPVGSLTPTYLHLAELAAAEAERHGATVARAYSPNATPANVLAAVDGAHVVIYFGHGYGHPSPYGGLNTARQNGWALQGPRAHGTHGDSLNGELVYYGEDWIVANARPAPGFVMIYSNVCYAPGASEGGHRPASEADALARVAHYSRKVFTMGGSAFYAVDFDRGAADLLGRILGGTQTTYGTHFASDHRYVPSALRSYQHPFSAGRQVWLHRTKYTDGPPNYWYAFAGDQAAVPARSWDPKPPAATLATRASDLSLTAAFRVAFGEAVRGIGPETIRLIGPDGERVPADVRLDEGSDEAILTPAAPLAMGTRYRLEVAAGVTDPAGNAATPAEWDVATVLDADPFEEPAPMVLQPGTHELVRVDALGAIVERKQLDLPEVRRLVAQRRMRLPGLSGSWLEIGSTSLAGWSVVESDAAHLRGLVDEAAFPAGTTIRLSADSRRTFGVDAAGAQAGRGVLVLDDETVPVDRRIVADGVLLVRVAADHEVAGGRWVRIDPSEAPPEAAARRRLSVEVREDRARVELGPGAWTAYRFDESGRVVARRTVDVESAPDLETTKSANIGGAMFVLITGGELDGWAISADDRHTVRPIEDPADSAD